jgi:4-amino-4-deoxychorismate lyase
VAETGWQSLTFIDGEHTDTLPVTDRAIQYGDGLFETFRWDGQHLLMRDAHLRRLQAGCQRLHIALDVEYLVSQITAFQHAIHQVWSGPAVVKLIVSRGSGGRGYTPPESAEPRVILQLHPLPDDLSRLSQEGIAAIQSTVPVTINPVLAGLKHLNRLDSVLASQELASIQRKQSFAVTPSESLLCNSRGEFIEGSRSNLFMVLENKLVTPVLDDCGVAGVVRDQLLGSADRLGVECISASITTETLGMASEVFICNSVIGIQPIHTLYLLSDKHQSSYDCLTFSQCEVTRRCQELMGVICGISL